MVSIEAIARVQEITDGFFARWSPDGASLAVIAGHYPSTQIRVIPLH